MRILRVYHGGRDQAHRARERALVDAGLDVTLVVPDRWPGAAASEPALSPEPFRIVELPVRRPGHVNRHTYADRRAVARLIAETRPDVLDIHEEPFSLAARQWLSAAPPEVPVVMYTAQNIDKRFPPPFAWYERKAHVRAQALYPCSFQAASVARGKGFGGLIEVLPLGYDEEIFTPGVQRADAAEVVLAFVGRLVPEKGVIDALDILEGINRTRPARLLMVGAGPEADAVALDAAECGLADRLVLSGWRSPRELADFYSLAHAVLVPSRTSPTWVEQFGRVAMEAQACGAVVAGYATGTIPEVGGNAALLVEEGNSVALAARLVDLLANERAYEARRKAGFALAAGRTWTRVAQRQASFYGRVLVDDWEDAERARSRSTQREAARLEFGPTALTPAGYRPFALRLLQKGRWMPRLR